MFSMSLVDRDSVVVWHPYSDGTLFNSEIAIVSGKGAYLYEADGGKYIDAVASWWTNIHGHSHPHIVQKVAAQAGKLDHVIFSGFTHEPAILLAELLLGRLPGNQKKVFYSDNGSTAVEVALKMAFQFWYNKGEIRNKVIAFKNSYHGDTFGAMSVSERGAFTKPFENLLFDVIYLDVPVPGKEVEILSELSVILAHSKSQIASFIFEPLVLGTAGMLMYEPKVLDALLTLCKSAGILTIADEVMTGFGRTGKFFACDYLTTHPDLFCLSKGLTGGTMAMGVTSCTLPVFEVFKSGASTTFFHGHSYTANPIACSAAIGSLELFERAETMEAVIRIEQLHTDFVQKIGKSKKVKHARSRGTILAIELLSDSGTSYFNTLRKQIYTFFIARGILLRPLGNIIYVMPPYCISTEDLNYVYLAIEEFIDSL